MIIAKLENKKELADAISEDVKTGCASAEELAWLDDYYESLIEDKYDEWLEERNA